MFEWINYPPYIFLFHIQHNTMEEEVKVVEAEAVEEEVAVEEEAVAEEAEVAEEAAEEEVPAE